MDHPMFQCKPESESSFEDSSKGFVAFFDPIGKGKRILTSSCDSTKKKIRIRKFPKWVGKRKLTEEADSYMDLPKKKKNL